ncbi:MAG: hypothetical protein ABI883_02495 [Chthoniobacterales bacterium]
MSSFPFCRFRLIFAVICSCLLLAVRPAASGEVERRSAYPLEELEKYEDAPSYIFRRGVSPRMISQHDSFTSYQVNVDAAGQNITGDAANEPSLCLDPTDRNRMSIGWRQFNSVGSNFRQSGWGYTSDGGTSWTFPGVLENNVFRSDPVLASDDTGRFFYLSLLQSFADDMWRSDTGGSLWQRLAPARGGDKQWFTIDPTAGSGHGFQYQIWSTQGNNYQGRQFTRSTDGGFTWLDPILIPNTPSWGTLDVDSVGTLYLGGLNFNSGLIYCVRSSNARNAAVIPTFDRSTVVNLGGEIVVGDPINPAGLVGQITVAADRSGASTKDNVYLLASVRPTNPISQSDVMFVRSTDGGQTFSSPRRINDDLQTSNKWHWMGSLAIAPNGRLDSVWLDSRQAANNTDSQLYYSYSYDGGITWAPNVSVSNSFNPLIGYPNQNKMGDYLTIVSDPTGGNVAYCATFNQEQDIYYVRVQPAAPVPQRAVSRKIHGTAGPFDVLLPLTGNPGIECRTGSGANADTHQLVVSFASPVSLSGVTVAGGDGLATATSSVNGGVVTIDLSQVTDAQTLTVTLLNVNDGVRFGPVAIPFAVLLGDVNADRLVNAADALQTRSRAGQSADAASFRADVNTDSLINGGDTVRVRSRSGMSLP